MTHLPAAQHAAAPWKNGLGVSRVIATEPAAAGFDTMLWQVSATEISADCPFSDLPGLDRHFTVIEGNGVELTSVDERGANRSFRAEAGQSSCEFRGDWRTYCRLVDGPVRVFNVIVRRGRFAAEMSFAEGRAAKGNPGQILVAVNPKTLDAWRLDGAGSLELPAGAAIVVRIRKA